MIKIVVGIILSAIALLASEPVQKAVFDCASNDMKFVQSRMWLVEESAKEFEAQKTPYAFVVTIHSGCTQIVDQSSNDETIKKIQQRLKTLHERYHVRIEACEIAVERWGYEKEELLPFIETVPNSITRVIRLENSGYALVPYH
jgi:intracellular sulfur oxidation DsrE/DsrF family protein